MVTLYHTPILCFSIRLQDSSTVAGLILQQSLARLYTVKIIFLFCADTILQQWYSLLKNHAVYQEYDTRPDKCIKLLKLQEKLHCKLQKQHIVTLVNVVVNVAIAVSVASIAYSKIFQVFTMRMDFFVQTGGTKETLAVKISPILPLSWLVSEKNVRVRNFGFT